MEDIAANTHQSLRQSHDTKGHLRCKSALRVRFFAFIDLCLLSFFELDLELLAKNEEPPLGLQAGQYSGPTNTNEAYLRSHACNGLREEKCGIG